MIDTKQVSIDFEALAKEYAGSWVALHPVSGAVVASGNTATVAYEKAVTLGVDCPLVNLIVEDYSVYAP